MDAKFRSEVRFLDSWSRALRLHQWAKNFLVFVPLIAAHKVQHTELLMPAMLAFLCFGLAASSAYVLNDFLDLDADRKHPYKRDRPFAAGELSLAHGGVVAFVLSLTAMVIAAMSLPPAFVAVLAAYLALTTLYSAYLKRFALLDVLTLAGLYTLRIIGGGAAVDVPVSFWLLAFSIFLFLSLAVVKRVTELLAVRNAGDHSPAGRGYTVDDLPVMRSLGIASGYISVLVLALYINSPASQVLYRRPEVIWLLCPLLLYWISRVWLLASRDAMHDDPIVFAAFDRVSWIVLALGAAVAWTAS
ncbi:MAG: UbiA family prenyltransferase [Betaproteobacteria bacterium]|nr:MAG: UbiA family prenyltransferase [Betaproteobacteria bacterium]TMH54022.1 MAG: UbiA family prenyltransferase [Betaproteobacteria bacterium]